ncbi:MAG: hypothetical protein FJX20_20925 [Alphaproteobacteria bacterium]|nr:hypothetical protein [Alphaproteobacteria bacterium]
MVAQSRSIAELDARADAAVRRYDRATWIRFTITFLPVPLIVVILRLQADAWVYYVYGVAVVVLTLSMFLLDGAARDRRDAAIRAAEQARLMAASQD